MGEVDVPSETRSSNHGPSFLRWAGSKRKSLRILSSAFSDESRQYVEPFAGSAALFFSLQPREGLLGDLNGHLVNAMRHVRDCPSELHKQLATLKRSSTIYYEVRDAFNSMRPNGLEAAVYFVYLNRNCFNGLWRTNSKGLFNVPFGGHEMGGNPPLSLLQDCSAALKRVKLRHQDFRKTIAEAGRHSFIYADPPYFSSADRTFIEYGKKSFGPQDLNDLIVALREAVHRGANVVLTYNESMAIKGIPRNWHRARFEITRNVGGFSGSRKKQVEILYSNSPIVFEAA